MSRPMSLAELTQFASSCLQRTCVSPATADEVALALATTDAMGVFTHGTKLLAGYLKKLQGGGYVATAEPRIEREGPGWAIIDGQSALGQVGGLSAIRVAMQKARQVGIAYVGLRNTGHIGAAGYYAALAARAGMIAMVTGNDMLSVAAPGTRKAVLGSNPLAYAVPVPDGDPILLDIATAAVAGGKVYAAIQRGDFERFRHLNVHSDQQLDDLVGQAQRIVRGVEPQTLRDDQTVRQRVATQLSAVQSVLDGLLVDRPRRNILRRPR